jgi:hypothetical protein
MSSLFTRSTYDQVKTDSNFVQSTKPGYLTLTTPQESEKQCFPSTGVQIGKAKLGVNYNDAVQIENYLKGIGGELSRNVDIKTFVNRDMELVNKYENMPKNIPGDCSNFLDVNYTRLNPNVKLQEQAWNRYEYHIYDPMSRHFEGIQGFTEGNNRQGLSTRYDTRNQLEQKNKAMKKLAGKINGPLGSK